MAEVLSNVLANVIAVLLLAIIGLIVFAVSRTFGIKRFFGIGRPGASIRVYLSAIAVEPEGTVGTAQIEQGFYGDAITEIEYQSAVRLYSVLRAGPSSWFINTLFGSRAVAEHTLSQIEKSPSFRRYDDRRNAKTEVEYESEDVRRVYDQDCSILIGAPIYNLLTHHMMREPGVGEPAAPNPFFRFIREHDRHGNPIRGVRVIGGLHPEDKIRRERADCVEDYFIVSRVTLENRTKVFIAAGTCTAATAAAVEYLTDWRKYKKFRGDFGVLYGINLPPTSEGRESQLTSQEVRRRTDKLREFPQ